MMRWISEDSLPKWENWNDEDLLDAYVYVYELAKVAYACDKMKREITPGEIIARCFEAAQAIVAAAKRRTNDEQ